MQKPNIVLLTTGGTIASRFDAGIGGFVPALSGADLLATVPAIASLASFEVDEIAKVDSKDLSPETWVQLSERTNAALAREEITGVVITHGTDTMEETAYFLDLTTPGTKPVVLVGAQRGASEPDSDGPRNLLDAVRVCLSPEAAGKGVLVVLNGEINAARDVTKTSTVDREAFQSLEFGALGVADLETVRFYRAPLRRLHIPLQPGSQLGRVEIVMHYAGADGRVVHSLLANTPTLAGLVVAGSGLGNVSTSMYEAIAEVRKKGIPVVISTRVYTGRVMPLYAGKGGVQSLRDIGCILADNLNPQKARVLLMVALTVTTDLAQIQAYYNR